MKSQNSDIILEVIFSIIAFETVDWDCSGGILRKIAFKSEDKGSKKIVLILSQTLLFHL